MENTQLEIRFMALEDLDQVMEIEESSFAIPWSRHDFEESLLKSTSIYVVAVMDHQIVGYCGLWGVLDEGQINNVAVRKENRGHQIGAYMLQALLLEGERKGLTSFTLEVRVSNAPAIALYQKLGFESAGIRKNYYMSPREDAMIMWKYTK